MLFSTTTTSIWMLLLVATITITTVTATVKPWESEPQAYPSWKTKHESLVNLTKTHASDIKVVFLGDSITDLWSSTGAKVWNAHYANRHAYNYGIGGDRTENVLWRIANGEFDGLSPKLIVLMIGTNNVSINETADDIVRGIKAILDGLREKMAHANILILSVLPRVETNFDTVVHQINGQLAKMADVNKKLFYQDFTTHFETGLTKEVPGLFRDHLHPTEKGYQLWYELMEPEFVKLSA